MLIDNLGQKKRSYFANILYLLTQIHVKPEYPLSSWLSDIILLLLIRNTLNYEKFLCFLFTESLLGTYSQQYPKLSNQSNFYIKSPANIQDYPMFPFKTICHKRPYQSFNISRRLQQLHHHSQTEQKALSYADCIIPLGSVSINYKDLEKYKNFRQTVTNAPERKYHEKNKISVKKIGKTKIISFYRDLNREGKSELAKTIICTNIYQTRQKQITG